LDFGLKTLDLKLTMPIPLFGRTKPGGPINWLIVGLGNPGKKYSQTRHNVGFHIVDRLAVLENLSFDKRQNKALLARGTVQGVSIGLTKPQTFMNISGEAVAPLARFYKIEPAHIFVIYDDLDLPNAQLRIRMKGGAGGHKGMRSIIEHLGTQDFPRMRIGIGRPPGRMPVEAYVLQNFSVAQSEEMAVTREQAIDAIYALLTQGIEFAMNEFN